MRGCEDLIRYERDDKVSSRIPSMSESAPQKLTLFLSFLSLSFPLTISRCSIPLIRDGNNRGERLSQFAREIYKRELKNLVIIAPQIMFFSLRLSPFHQFFQFNISPS